MINAKNIPSGVNSQTMHGLCMFRLWSLKSTEARAQADLCKMRLEMEAGTRSCRVLQAKVRPHSSADVFFMLSASATIIFQTLNKLEVPYSFLF